MKRERATNSRKLKSCANIIYYNHWLSKCNPRVFIKISLISYETRRKKDDAYLSCVLDDDGDDDNDQCRR